MKPTEALGRLISLRLQIVETREAASRLGISVSYASHMLRSLQESGLVLRLRHGLWALDAKVEPFSVPPYLTAPYPAYVSFWSALAHHEMIEQIPRKIYAASLDRSRQVPTSIGAYSIHHLAPTLFDGYSNFGSLGFIATPEKALFDTIYVRAPRGGLPYLPEIELPESFSQEALHEWVNRVQAPRLRTLVSRGLGDALKNATQH